MSKQKENLEYETKCRRCGTFNEWYFSDREKISLFDFHQAMGSYIESPRICKCERCKKHTVQDVVSYDIN